MGSVKGVLLLEDGSVFPGRSFGAPGMSGGEVVFNTAMAGYQEILTDPSYAGQIVTMTYPLIGSYGVNEEDAESGRSFAAGFVVREYIGRHSNWRATRSLGEYLEAQKIVAVEGIDTRAVTLKLRERGALRGLVAAGDHDAAELRRRLADVPPMEGQDLTGRVACRTPFEWAEGYAGKAVSGLDLHAAVVDCGVKYGILRCLAEAGARVTVVPPAVTEEDLERLRPDMILASNGPGDPAAVGGLDRVLRAMIGRVPIFGICLGHQILALAIGGRTYKLKFGHHGANHPVRDERTRRIEITSQNHGFAVDADSLARLDGKTFGRVAVTHVHLSDGTVEGFELPEVGVKAIQYHPEAGPGPHDARHLFREFLECTRKRSTR